MSKQARVPTDPQTLKPIIEAMIFASEEPLSARALIRFLVGDRENEKAEDEIPPLAAMMDEGAPADAAGDAAVETEPVPDPPAGEVAAEEAASEEAAAEEVAVEEVAAEEVVVEESPVDDAPVNDAPVESDAGEVEGEDRPDEAEVAAAAELAEEAAAEAEASLEAEAAEEADAALQAAGSNSVLDAPTVADASVVAGGAIYDEMGVAGEPADLSDAMKRVESRSTRARDGVQQLDQAYIREMIAELNDEYQESGRVFRIVEVAGGFQFATVREYGEFVAMLSKEKLRRRLSPAALETLAIIAYRQPVSKPEVEAIRGVNSDQVLVNLMEKNLIAITGRSEGVGRPLLYGTTEDFLRSFGLKGIGDLPKLREIEELMEDDAYSPEKIEVVTVDANTDVEEIEARVGAAGHTDHDTEAQDGLPVSTEADPAAEPGEGEMIAEAAMTGDEEVMEETIEEVMEETIEEVMEESFDEAPAAAMSDEDSGDDEMEMDDEIDDDDAGDEEEMDDEEMDDEIDEDEIDDEELDDDDDVDDDDEDLDEEVIDEDDLDDEEIADDEELDDDLSDEEEEDDDFAELDDQDAPADKGHDEHANGASGEIPHDMRAA